MIYFSKHFRFIFFTLCSTISFPKFFSFAHKIFIFFVVAYSIEDKNKREQELQSLLNVGDNFKKMVIVYNSFIKWQDDNGIIYISIYDFLLNENSLDM